MDGHPLAEPSSSLRFLLPLSIAILVVACFLPALRADFVVWDDDLNFTLNEHYRGLSPANLAWMFTTFLGGHYQPLTWITLGLDYDLWGMHAPGYHLTNVVWHAANAVLVYFLIRTLIGQRNLPAAALGALGFAVHPLRVESVAWVTERRDVVSGFFYLLAVLSYLRMNTNPARRRSWLFASIACAGASLLAKAWAITLPAVLLVLDAYPLRRLDRNPRAVLLEKLPYVLLALPFAALAFAAQQVPEMRSLHELGVVARAAEAAYGLAFYVEKTLLPIGLSPLYRLEASLDPTARRYLLAAAFAVGVTAILIVLRRRATWALAAWACYVVILAPVLGLTQTGPQIVADRYSYLACIPWAVLAAAAISRGARVTRLVAVAGVALLGVLTFRQTAFWQDSFSLWDRALQIDPQSHHAFVNRGRAHELRGENEAALADYAAAIAANPSFALAYFDRGALRQSMGDRDGAIADDSEAARLDPRDPNAVANRGWAHDEKGESAEAAADYARALAIAPAGWPHRGTIEKRLADVTARRSRAVP